MTQLLNSLAVAVLSILCILSDQFLTVNASICEVGRERDASNEWGWTLPWLPYPNSCECTRVTMGGVNTWTPLRPIVPMDAETALVSDDINAIRKHYDLECDEQNKPTLQQSVSPFNIDISPKPISSRSSATKHASPTEEIASRRSDSATSTGMSTGAKTGPTSTNADASTEVKYASTSDVSTSTKAVTSIVSTEEDASSTKAKEASTSDFTTSAKGATTAAATTDADASTEAKDALTSDFLTSTKTTTDAQKDLSCIGLCGSNTPARSGGSTCWCDTVCTTYSNCCDDYQVVCQNEMPDPAFSCQNRCGDSYNKNLECQCNTQCVTFSDCCQDYNDYCM